MPGDGQAQRSEYFSGCGRPLRGRRVLRAQGVQGRTIALQLLDALRRGGVTFVGNVVGLARKPINIDDRPAQAALRSGRGPEFCKIKV